MRLEYNCSEYNCSLTICHSVSLQWVVLEAIRFKMHLSSVFIFLSDPAGRLSRAAIPAFRVWLHCVYSISLVISQTVHSQQMLCLLEKHSTPGFQPDFTQVPRDSSVCVQPPSLHTQSTTCLPHRIWGQPLHFCSLSLSIQGLCWSGHWDIMALVLDHMVWDGMT